MSFVQRSPTRASPTTPQLLGQAQSDPDLSYQETDPSSQLTNITSRVKRPRIEIPPTESSLERKLDTWMNKQTIFMSKLSEDIAEVKLQNLEIQKTNQEIEKKIQCLSTKYDNIESKILSMEKERQTINDHIMDVNKNVEDIKNYSHSAAFELRNVPNTENESLSNLNEMVLNLVKCLDFDLKVEEIRDIYRLPGKPDSKRPIVVELTTVIKKNSLLASAKSFNRSRQATEKLNSELIRATGAKVPIYVDEHLYASTKKLYYTAREFAKSNNFKFCWTKRGRILLRKDEEAKVFTIKSEECLKEIPI
ncbi:unnamed protein product [Plutella xylostella]|uniref:(diamondback moth) hypothetical protein n=1 Tax=Plutella xylostella TaxID=51655 RepID=A0A8S4GCG7_PLUXY|nr:unnamed protein product [Plutella xylostella]